jgi:hypothetical protein
VQGTAFAICLAAIPALAAAGLSTLFALKKAVKN